jgi:hypothetical protein
MKIYRLGSQKIFDNLNIINIIKHLTQLKIITENDLHDNSMRRSVKTHQLRLIELDSSDEAKAPKKFEIGLKRSSSISRN